MVDRCCDAMTTVLKAGCFPITIGNDTNELRIPATQDGDRYYCVLHYCPFCGSKLNPFESARSEFENNPEVIELLKKSDDITSVEKMRSIFGEPDSTSDFTENNQRGAVSWVQKYEYWSQFNTCRLTVRIRADGQIDRIVAPMSPERKEWLNEETRDQEK